MLQVQQFNHIAKSHRLEKELNIWSRATLSSGYLQLATDSPAKSELKKVKTVHKQETSPSSSEVSFRGQQLSAVLHLEAAGAHVTSLFMLSASVCQQTETK